MSKTALLIIDMQIFFSSMTTECLPNILTLSAFFRDHSMPQVFTQHGHSKLELAHPEQNQLVRKWGPEGSIAHGSKDWELMSQIVRAWEEAGKPEIVGKNTYDAFINTNLEERLREMGVERVVLCGVMTDCCCDTTGRAAFNRGFETWLVGDACGSVNRTQHERGLKVFGFGFGEVLPSREVLQRLGG